MECSRDGIHRPPVSGIHGGPDGAYSVALSGGYAENLDEGDHFWYTGEGGRELKGTKSDPKVIPHATNKNAFGVFLAQSSDATCGSFFFFFSIFVFMSTSTDFQFKEISLVFRRKKKKNKNQILFETVESACERLLKRLECFIVS